MLLKGSQNKAKTPAHISRLHRAKTPQLHQLLLPITVPCIRYHCGIIWPGPHPPPGDLFGVCGFYLGSQAFKWTINGRRTTDNTPVSTDAISMFLQGPNGNIQDAWSFCAVRHA